MICGPLNDKGTAGRVVLDPESYRGAVECTSGSLDDMWPLLMVCEQ